MEPTQLNWIANFIWSIADDVLRDLYVRGKYRDVILPMTVLRRLDAVLEPTKQAVLDMKAALDRAGIANQDRALRQAAGQAFYNTSGFTLRDLKARWQDDSYAEQRIRERLHYVLPGETGYIVIDPDAAARTRTDQGAADRPWYDNVWDGVDKADGAHQ